MGDSVAEYPATKGITSTQIMAASARTAGAIGDVVEPLPARGPRGRAAADRPRRARAPRTSATARAAAGGWPSTSCCSTRSSSSACARERRAAARAPPLADAARRYPRRGTSELLPFAPTNDQQAAMAEVDADLAAERPMARLLMGEVGSGKTVVALHAMLRAVEHGMQAALMAPTETLAEQHFATLQALMPGELVPAALLTGSTPAGRRADAARQPRHAARCR